MPMAGPTLWGVQDITAFICVTHRPARAQASDSTWSMFLECTTATAGPPTNCFNNQLVAMRGEVTLLRASPVCRGLNSRRDDTVAGAVPERCASGIGGLGRFDPRSMDLRQRAF